MARTLLSHTPSWIRTAHRATSTLVAIGIVVAGFSTTLMAQLPSIKLNNIFPPGAKQGTEVEVKIAGTDQDEANKLIFSHAGITATQKMTPATATAKAKPVAGTFVVKVAANVPPGVYEARAGGRFGVSNPRAFSVGILAEVNETAGNNLPTTAMEVAIGSVVNGRTDASKVDYYKLTLKKGQRVLIDCCAQRIDSRADATITLYSPSGGEIKRVRDIQGTDPVIDYTAPADGPYVVGVYDFVYAGGADYVYRLNVHSGPYIDFVFPPSGVPGSNGQFTVYGRNLPGGQPAPNMTVYGNALQKLTVNIALPGDAASQQKLALGTYVEPRGVLLDGTEYRLATASPVRIGYAKAPVILEKEPNNDATTAQKVTLPCEYVGQFYPARDDDTIQFDAKKGEVYWIEVISHRLGINSDPYMMIKKVTKDKDGKEVVADVTQVDDPSNRNSLIGSNFDITTDDPSYRLAVPQDATYRVMIRDRSGTSGGDARYVYRLVIRPEQPDFRLIALPTPGKVANANVINQTSSVLRKGSTTLVDVRVNRLDGFKGDVDVSIEGLPAGVTCTGATVTGSTASLVLVAADNAAAWSGPIRVVGKAKVNDKDAVRYARAGTVVWGTTNRTTIRAAYRVTRDFTLSIVDKDMQPAFVKAGDSKILETSLGGKLEVPVKVTRRGDFKADLKLVATGVPAELKPADVTIKGAAADGKLAISVTNAKAKPGLYSFYLKGDAKFKYVRNPEAIKASEAEQKRLDALVKGLTPKSKTAATAKAATDKAATTTAATVKTTTTAKTAADKVKTTADTTAKAAATKATAAAKAVTDAANVVKLATTAKAKGDQAKAAADASAKAAATSAATFTKAATDAANVVKTTTAAKVAADKVKATADAAAKAAAAKLTAAQTAAKKDAKNQALVAAVKTATTAKTTADTAAKAATTKATAAATALTAAQAKATAAATVKANADKAKTAADVGAATAVKTVAALVKGLAAVQVKATAATTAKTAADKAKVTADAAAVAATTKATAAAKALTDAQAKAKTAAAAKVAADKVAADAAAALKTATTAKTNADKALAAVKKANAAKDVTVSVISTPIKLRVVATPITLTAGAPAALKQEAKIEVPITLAKKYSFDDAVQITITPPKGVAGITAAKLAIAKGQTQGKLVITAAKNATPGKHTVSVKATAKFNNINVTTTADIALNVEKVTPPAAKK